MSNSNLSKILHAAAETFSLASLTEIVLGHTIGGASHHLIVKKTTKIIESIAKIGAERKLPGNHDLLKVVRTAMLRATLYMAGSLKDEMWAAALDDKQLDYAKQFNTQLVKWITNEIGIAEEWVRTGHFDPAILNKVEVLISETGKSESRATQQSLLAEKATEEWIKEIENGLAIPLPEILYIYMRIGWTDRVESTEHRMEWFTITSYWFGELLKQKEFENAKTAFQNKLLSEILSGTGVVQKKIDLVLNKLKKSIGAGKYIQARWSVLEDMLRNIDDKLEDLKTKITAQHQESLERIKEISGPQKIQLLSREELINILIPGFINSIEQLLAFDSKPEIQTRAGQIAKWLNLPGSYKILEKGLMTALEKTGRVINEHEETDRVGPLMAQFNLNEAHYAIPRIIAAATLEMVREEERIIPQYLLHQTALTEIYLNYFKKFLFILRQNLAIEQGFADVISYANELVRFGLMDGFANRIANSIDYIAKIEEALRFEFRSRRLTDDRVRAMGDYLQHLREYQLTYSLLPLVKASSQDRTDARLKDIFVPITISLQEKNYKKRLNTLKHSREKDDDFTTGNSTLGGLLRDKRRMILLGPPGGGKTTLLRHLALMLSEGRLHEIEGLEGYSGAIPIFLRLRSFAAYLQSVGSKFIEPCAASIIGYLEDYYRETARLTLTPDFFDKILDEGACVVCMDGLDEVPQNKREEVAMHIKEFMLRYGQVRKEEARSFIDDAHMRNWNNLFLLTSRPKGFESVQYFLQSSALTVCEVKPLAPPGIRQLINNLLNYIELDKAQRTKDYNGICQSIFAEDDLVVLAAIPLFCTSLVMMYKYGGSELPERRVDVYEEIINLLLGYWKAQDMKSRVVDDDNLDSGFTDLKTIVKKNKRRLSHIAFKMQYRENRTEIDFVSLVGIISAYLMEKERIAEHQATDYAERFLVNSHEKSGLLVEMEPSEPPIYSFTHDGFREYLVADAMVNLSESKFVNTILEKIDNQSWDEVILLAGAHSELGDARREILLDSCIDAANKCKLQNNWEGWSRRLIMAGRMARDMKDDLSPNDRDKLKEVLYAAMTDVDNQPRSRVDIALVLDEIGWLTESLYSFVLIDNENTSPYLIGKNLVSNQQYQRFLNAPDFYDENLWQDPFCVDHKQTSYSLHDESLFWLETHKEELRLPKLWTDPKFGVTHKGLPVVGLSWFEASAYCRWLQKHWHELDESKQNPGISPKRVRLPFELEWQRAVSRTSKDNKISFKIADFRLAGANEEIFKYANMGDWLQRTTPLGMFSQGSGYVNELLDIWGNAWEWQSSLFDASRKGMCILGGSFSTSKEDIDRSLRGWAAPMDRFDDTGLRLLIEI